MTHKFKVGERVRLDGMVLGTVLGTTHVQFDGCEWGASCGIIPDAMAHATLIPPAQEPKAPPILDTSKPMQMDDGSEVTFVDRTESGKILVWDSDMHLRLLDTDDLENIPTPKQTASREMVLLDGWKTLITAQGLSPEEAKKIIARGTITLTEGDGMEAVKS
jgi:hypothetical protein